MVSNRETKYDAHSRVVQCMYEQSVSFVGCVCVLKYFIVKTMSVEFVSITRIKFKQNINEHAARSITTKY